MTNVTRSLVSLRSSAGILILCAGSVCCPAAETPWYLSAEKDATAAHEAKSNLEKGADASAEAPASAPAFLPQPTIPATLPDEEVHRTVKPGTPFVPLTTRQKARLQLLTTFQPESLARIAFTSGLATLRDSPQEWPSTIGAYNWRFADRLGQRLVYRQVQFTVGSVLLKEDPRYYLAEKPGTMARVKSAFKQTWLTRRDDGTWRPAYGTFAGAFAAGAVSSRWQPESRQSLECVLTRGGSQILFQFGNNLIREFMPDLKKKFKR